MKSKKLTNIISFLLFIMFGITPIYSQYNIQFQNPKTPEVYLFEKYGGLPISLYTGKPTISIPIYTIQEGDITVPLNLVYSSNGIRVDEEASQFGLGWYMSTGMITQIVNGKDDLAQGNFVKTPQYLWSSSISRPIIPNPEWNVSPGGVNQLPNNSTNRVVIQSSSPDLDKYFIKRLRSEGSYGNFVYYDENMTDYKPALDFSYGMDVSVDVFRANFFGNDLLFYIQPSNNSAVFAVKVINNEKYKVELEVISDAPNFSKYHWTIISPEGITYSFEEEKKTNYSSSSDVHNSESIESNGTGYSTFLGLMGSTNHAFNHYSNSRTWKITKIKDIKGNEVLFKYEQLPTIISSAGTSGKVDFINIENKSNEYRNIGLWTGTFTNLNYNGPNFSANSSYPDYELGRHTILRQNSGSAVRQEKSILKEILFSNSKIDFVNSERIDIPHDKKTSQVNIFYGTNIIQTINLTQSYFDGQSTSNIQKRLKLDAISLAGKLYNFYYNSINLPNKDSNSFDYWGYYNGMPNTSSINNPFRLYQNSNSIPFWAKPFLPSLEGKANRSAHSTNCKAGILEKIVYPTGGYTEIEYELNEFDNLFFPDINNKTGVSSNNYINDYNQSSSQGYGLRVKSTKDFTDEYNYIKKVYTYVGGKHIPAYTAYNDIDRYKTVVNQPSASSPNGYYCKIDYGTKITAYNSSLFQTGIFSNGDFVGYDSVSVTTESSDLQNNGKIVSYFTNIADKSPRERFNQGGLLGPMGGIEASFCDYFGQSIRNSNVDNGLLVKEEIYDRENNLVNKIENTYQSFMEANILKYNVQAVTLPGFYGYLTFGNYEEVFSEYLFLYYPLKASKTRLQSKKNTDYFTNGSKWTITSYSYDQNNMLISTKKSSEPGVYFYEENSINNSDPQLLNKNILNLPLWSSHKENQQVKTYHRYFYNISSNAVTTQRIENLPEGNPNPNNITRLFYELYDEKSNLLQFRKDYDIPTSIIWGYHKTLPVAKLENVEYSTIPPGIITSIQEASNEDNELELLENLESLRSLFPAAMITSYTHYPLVGVRSITDSKGDWQTYHYLNNRLQFVKDKNGNILSEHEYHFINQN